ncbi:hypothetical protein FEK50_07645 [Escherichia sp. E2586]|nr:hypothetical protein FEK66_09035 [Escherichia sp. E1130]TLI75604.1 hypothetical protein FEK50_07645 [Escherichia sp. E2586]
MLPVHRAGKNIVNTANKISPKENVLDIDLDNYQISHPLGRGEVQECVLRLNHIILQRDWL